MLDRELNYIKARLKVGSLANKLNCVKAILKVGSLANKLNYVKARLTGRAIDRKQLCQGQTQGRALDRELNSVEARLKVGR